MLLCCDEREKKIFKIKVSILVTCLVPFIRVFTARGKVWSVMVQHAVPTFFKSASERMHGHAVLLFRKGPNELLTGTMSQWKPTPTKIKKHILMPLETFLVFTLACVWYAKRRLRWLSQRKGTRLRFSCAAINVFEKKDMFLFLLIAHFHNHSDPHLWKLPYPSPSPAFALSHLLPSVGLKQPGSDCAELHSHKPH